jgi:shikimate kinase
MIFILALLVVRMALRGALTSSTGIAGLSATAAYDDLILLAGGMMVTQGLEMWLRARRLLAQAQAAKAEDSTASPRPVAP